MTTPRQELVFELTEVQLIQIDLEYERWKASIERRRQEADMAQRREAGLSPYPSGLRTRS